MDKAPPSLGVCDDPEQFAEAFPTWNGFVYLMPVTRQSQPPYEGWRWCKWGKYVGKYNIRGLEYLVEADGKEGRPLINVQWYFNVHGKRLCKWRVAPHDGSFPYRIQEGKARQVLWETIEMDQLTSSKDTLLKMVAPFVAPSEQKDTGIDAPRDIELHIYGLQKRQNFRDPTLEWILSKHQEQKDNPPIKKIKDPIRAIANLSEWGQERNNYFYKTCPGAPATAFWEWSSAVDFFASCSWNLSEGVFQDPSLASMCNKVYAYQPSQARCPCCQQVVHAEIPKTNIVYSYYALFDDKERAWLVDWHNRRMSCLFQQKLNHFLDDLAESCVLYKSIWRLVWQFAFS